MGEVNGLKFQPVEYRLNSGTDFTAVIEKDTAIICGKVAAWAIYNFSPQCEQ